MFMSRPYLAKADHGERFLDLAATALCKDLEQFLASDAP
jgi:creatinine amidohydrolase